MAVFAIKVRTKVVSELIEPPETLNPKPSFIILVNAIDGGLKLLHSAWLTVTLPIGRCALSSRA